MSFTPVIPFGGYAGWAFLSRTRASQEEAFTSSAPLRRAEDYFRDRIGTITTAEDLVSDRRLLQVALDAFGLGDDIDNRYFIRKVLEDGTLDTEALANRLSDKRYLEFSKAFGFGDYDTPRTALSDFADTILARYESRQFEEAVGAQDENMRLALNAERELGTLAGRSLSNDAKWYSVLGSPPLRQVFETAFGLPSSFAAIDIDRQVAVLREKADAFLGDGEIGQFADPAKTESLIRVFLVRSEASSGGAGHSARATALTLLQSSGGTGGLLSLLV